MPKITETDLDGDGDTDVIIITEEPGDDPDLVVTPTDPGNGGDPVPLPGPGQYGSNEEAWDEYAVPMANLVAARYNQRNNVLENFDQGRPTYGPDSKLPDDPDDLTFELWGFWQYPGDLATLQADPVRGNGFAPDMPGSEYVLLSDGSRAYGALNDWLERV